MAHAFCLPQVGWAWPLPPLNSPIYGLEITGKPESYHPICYPLHPSAPHTASISSVCETSVCVSTLIRHQGWHPHWCPLGSQEDHTSRSKSTVSSKPLLSKDPTVYLYHPTLCTHISRSASEILQDHKKTRLASLGSALNTY